MRKVYRPLVWAGRVPVFTGALALYVVTAVVSAVVMHGRRAPAVALSLAPVAARMVADGAARRFEDLYRRAARRRV